ncbi:hypothetical protein DFH28DRAFT_1093279 [Melampsora americana]|nr:hypothetical protein DFH28DRAFT_1093279 [Melampsora americana]
MTTHNTQSHSQLPTASSQRGLPALRGRGSKAQGRKNGRLKRPPPPGPMIEEDKPATNPNPPISNTDNPSIHTNERLTPPLAKKIMPASPEAVTELKLAQKKFQWLVYMIAMISDISLLMAKKELNLINPNDSPTTAYDQWRSYGKLALQNAMPNRGKLTPSLGTCNTIVGATWSSLNADEKAVFEAPLFHALAGLPNYSAFATEEINMTISKGPAVDKLNDRKEAHYRPIFERLVDMERVNDRQGEAFDENDHQRKSLKALKRFIIWYIACAADKNDWAYYFLVASAHQSSKAGKLGWSKFYTSHPAAGDYVEQEADFASTFSAYVQGLSARKKIELENTLLEMLTSTIGYKPKQGLPRGPNPQEVFKTHRIPVKLVQHSGHALPAALLSAGFNKMNCKGQELWQQDIDNGLFTMEKTDLEVIPHTQKLNQANNNKKVKSKEFVDLDDKSKEEEEGLGALEEDKNDDSSEEEDDDSSEEEDDDSSEEEDDD